MSVLNQSGEEQVECPLCMEPLEVDDLHFYPCTCGYQICRFCWNRIREGENGLCPACRKAYPENPADFTPLSQEQVAAIKTEKKAREQKRRNKTLESRRALANVRVVQNNLVFVVGLPVRLADPEILKRQEYFGKYGKIHKVVINQSTTYAGSQGPSASAYVTYVSSADALRAIQGVNNVTLDGRVLKGSLGTTKYCANFMKNQPCPKPDCMYLHELGDPKASFTKEEMHAGLHQVYERKLHNQLLASQRDPTNSNNNSNGNGNGNGNGSGNSSTNAEKGSSKDGNPSNFIPTTVVTSSHINVVNSSKSKKGQDSMNGSVGSVGSSSSGSSKDAWPSLAPSSPGNSPHKHSPDTDTKGKSQENSTSESSSPILSQPTHNPQPASKSKDSESKQSRKENAQNTKKNKDKNKQKSNSLTTEEQEAADKAAFNTHSVFETSEYLSNELDELESDRHSLLENHDLLDNSDHSLLEDDTHNLLDTNSEVLMMQRHRDMLHGLVDNHLLPPTHKSPLMNGYGLLDREMSFDRPVNPMGTMEQKEMRHDMLRHRNHFMPTSSIGLESASELLGANFHQNPNMLPFGMRVDNSMANSSMAGSSMVNSLGANTMGSSMGVNTMGNAMGANSMGANTMVNPMGANSMGANTMTNPMGANTMGNTMGGNSMGNTLGVNSMGNTMGGNAMGNTMGGNSLGNSMGANTMGGSSMSNGPLGNSMGGFMLHNQQMMQQNQQMQSGLVNGFDNPQTANEGRYLAENMDKFFTDFHKAQQMRMLMSRSQQQQQQQPATYHTHTHNMLSAEAIEMEHKQRMNNIRAESMGRCAAGDGDDDLDFDPFKETQKALAEMMESEMMQTTVSSGDTMDRVRRSRAPPPGFGHVNTYNMQPQMQMPRSLHPQDWTQMDPAIMSTSVNFGKPPQQPAGMGMGSAGINNSALSPQQQELFARFNHLSVQPNGINKIQMPLMQQWAQNNSNKLGWGYNSIPLPPGFAPAKPSNHNHAAECIDAK